MTTKNPLLHLSSSLKGAKITVHQSFMATRNAFQTLCVSPVPAEESSPRSLHGLQHDHLTREEDPSTRFIEERKMTPPQKCVRRSDAQSLARRNTPLERSKPDLAALRSPGSPKLQKINPLSRENSDFVLISGPPRPLLLLLLQRRRMIDRLRRMTRLPTGVS